MGDISKNLNRSEMACKCGCGFNACDIRLVEVFQKCCDHFATETKQHSVLAAINSGCRCAEHNAKEGGAKDSAHVKGTAMDFWIKGVHPDAVAVYLDRTYPDRFGIGQYNGRTHLDIRATKARWDNR